MNNRTQALKRTFSNFAFKYKEKGSKKMRIGSLVKPGMIKQTHDPLLSIVTHNTRSRLSNQNEIYEWLTCSKSDEDLIAKGDNKRQYFWKLWTNTPGKYEREKFKTKYDPKRWYSNRVPDGKTKNNTDRYRHNYNLNADSNRIMLHGASNEASSEVYFTCYNDVNVRGETLVVNSYHDETYQGRKMKFNYDYLGLEYDPLNYGACLDEQVMMDFRNCIRITSNKYIPDPICDIICMYAGCDVFSLMICSKAIYNMTTRYRHGFQRCCLCKKLCMTSAISKGVSTHQYFQVFVLCNKCRGNYKFVETPEGVVLPYIYDEKLMVGIDFSWINTCAKCLITGLLHRYAPIKSSNTYVPGRFMTTEGHVSLSSTPYKKKKNGRLLVDVISEDLYNNKKELKVITTTPSNLPEITSLVICNDYIDTEGYGIGCLTYSYGFILFTGSTYHYGPIQLHHDKKLNWELCVDEIPQDKVHIQTAVRRLFTPFFRYVGFVPSLSDAGIFNSPEMVNLIS